MRKRRSAKVGFIIAVIMLAVSCGGAKEDKVSNNKTVDKDIIQIGERMFITQVNDIYLNANDYLGKTIKLEGIFKYEETYNFVVRYGLGGCCGYDANVGFEVMWDKNREKPYPAAESWVEAEGVLKVAVTENNSQYLYLDLASLNVLEKRGKETVFQ